jgi:hypothetical protein
VTDKDVQTVGAPEVRMTFEYEKDAYEMYNTYTEQIGFNIKKSNIKWCANKSTYSKLIICSSQEFRETNSSHASIRTGCNTCIQFSVSKEEI